MVDLSAYPDIEASELEARREPVRIIDPSPGIFGGEPVPGLVSIEYECHGQHCNQIWSRDEPDPIGFTAMPTHTHGALYGPHLKASCGQPHIGCNHPLIETGEPGYELYAD
jgi:hypothetical protein